MTPLSSPGRSRELDAVAAKATVMVDLHRSGAKSVPLWRGAPFFELWVRRLRSGGSGSFSNAAGRQGTRLRPVSGPRGHQELS